jgi:hypothetical protein
LPIHFLLRVGPHPHALPSLTLRILFEPICSVNDPGGVHPHALPSLTLRILFEPICSVNDPGGVHPHALPSLYAPDPVRTYLLSERPRRSPPRAAVAFAPDPVRTDPLGKRRRAHSGVRDIQDETSPIVAVARIIPSAFYADCDTRCDAGGSRRNRGHPSPDDPRR